MAAYHYKLEVVPKEFVGDPPWNNISLEEIDNGLRPWTTTNSISKIFLDELRALLPTDQSWGEVEEYVAGRDGNSDIRIWWDAGQLDNISFRFSPISDSWSLMQKFLAIVEAAGYLLIDQASGKVLLPSETMVKDQFLQSPAFRFLRDPQAAILAASGTIFRNE